MKPTTTGRPYGGRHVQRLRAMVWSGMPHTCWLCNQPITSWAEFEVDHVLPRSKGGTDSLANLRPSHGRLSSTPCNQRRGNRIDAQARPGVGVDSEGWFTQREPEGRS